MINDISLPWSTADLFKDIDKKSKKKPKKKISVVWGNEYNEYQGIYKKYSKKKPKKSNQKKRNK